MISQELPSWAFRPAGGSVSGLGHSRQGGLTCLINISALIQRPSHF